MTRLHSIKKTRLTLIIAFVFLSLLFFVSRSFLISEGERIQKAVNDNLDQSLEPKKAGTKNGPQGGLRSPSSSVNGGKGKFDSGTVAGNTDKKKGSGSNGQKNAEKNESGSIGAKPAGPVANGKKNGKPVKPDISPKVNIGGGRVSNVENKYGSAAQPANANKGIGKASPGGPKKASGPGRYEEDGDDSESDPHNPHKYLGDVEEMDDDEKEILGNIYEGDEEKVGVPRINPKTGEIDNARKQANGKPPILENKTPPVLPVNAKSIQKLNFRIYSHNVKNGGHDQLVPGEEDWSKRVNQVAASIMFNAQHNSIVALQEVYKFQLDQIIDILNKYESDDSKWEYYGVGRIDGELVGEFVPILYKKSDWQLIFSDSIWLNDRNQKMALEGWDAKYLRILSYVTLKHKQTNNYINVFNTHLDHVGQHAKSGSSSLIVRKIRDLNDWPSFLCGDLNLEPSDSSYHILADSLQDSSLLTTPFNHYGHVKSTVTGFQGEVLNTGGQNIDYIFSPSYTTKINDEDVCKTTIKDISNKISLRLVSWGMLHSKYNGLYMSDHRPLVGDFFLQAKNC